MERAGAQGGGAEIRDAHENAGGYGVELEDRNLCEQEWGKWGEM